MRRFNGSNTSILKDRNRKRRIRILLVDDHPSVLAGIRSHLRSKRDFNVVAHALNGEEAVKKAKILNPDVMIVDLSLPRLNGLEVMRKVRADNQETKFIIYTMHDGKEFLREAFLAGANGFVSKGSSLKKLVHIIERISHGETVVDPIIGGAGQRIPSIRASRIESTACEGKCTLEDRLVTEREKQILRSLSDGLKLEQIADQHAISFHTVVSHLRNIYDKLGVCSRSAAVAIAREKRII